MQSCIKQKTLWFYWTAVVYWLSRNYHCHLLPASLEITALDLCTKKDICFSLHVSMCIRWRDEDWDEGDKWNNGSDKVSEREGKNIRKSVVTFFMSWPFCLCVGLCVCAKFSIPVHVWVCQNSATLPSSSHRFRFVSLQLQVTKWHCAFIAALHGASHKLWND